MKKVICGIALCIMVGITSACSPLDLFKEGEPVIEEKDPNEIYAEVFVEVINDSNEILQQYNEAMDKLYSKKTSEEQFRVIIENLLPRSNQLIGRLDSVLYDVDDSLYDFHREFIKLTNFQHQIFLESLRMINEEERGLDKTRLRQDYVDVKTDQTKLVHDIKNILTDIQNIQNIEE